MQDSKHDLFSDSLHVLIPIKQKRKNKTIYKWKAIDIVPKSYGKSKQFELIATQDLYKGFAIPFFGTRNRTKCTAIHNQYSFSNLCAHKDHKPYKRNFGKKYPVAKIAFDGLGLAMLANEPEQGQYPNSAIILNEKFLFLVLVKDITKGTPITTYYGDSYDRKTYNYELPNKTLWYEQTEWIGLLTLHYDAKKKLQKYQNTIEI